MKQSRHTHVDQVIKIISVVVVYEQGVGLKSSITLDMSSRKDLTLQGCTNCPSWAPHARPSLSVATHHRQPFYDLVPRDPERQAPLSNNEQIRVAPGESTPNPQAGRALRSDSSVSIGFGLPGHPIWGRARAGQGWTNRETMSPLARIGLKRICRRPTDRYNKAGKW